MYDSEKMGIRDIFSRTPNYPKEFKKKYDALEIRTKGIRFVDSYKKQDLIIFFESWLDNKENFSKNDRLKYGSYFHLAGFIINILRGFYTTKDSVMEAHADIIFQNELLDKLNQKISDKALYDWYLYEIKWLINNMFY